MTGIVDWAATRARMVLAFILLSLVVGGYSYSTLPKEGEPDIEIPALFVSVPFPGISATDAETLLLKPMETELSDLDGLKKMTGTAAENYAGLALEFEFGWDKTKIIADVRDAMGTAEADFPTGAETYSINEINFSEFPIIIVNLTGPVPERTMNRYAKQLQEDLEGLDAVLEAGIAGNRDEMLEVLIDPLKLEAYNVTANELISVVQNNNQLIAAGEVESDNGTFAVKIPSSFDEPQDVYNLPVKTNGDRVVTLGDLAEINFTFEDRLGTARFDGDATVALQVVKRKGFNLIDTSNLVKQTVAQASADWPEELRTAVEVGTSNDQSPSVESMVNQLVGSVLTAVALVMIVVLAALGIRAALLVGFAIPTSFLLCFALLALMGISISNIVMFGLILAVGMLVDGAIVVVEYADARQQQGERPMKAYTEAAKRMFWPIISSTATTLCAFLPMLFWPGVPGEFMGMLPVTLIFVLSASLVVALIYLPVMGGVTGRLENWITSMMERFANLKWYLHLPLAIPGVLIWAGLIYALAMLLITILIGAPPVDPALATEAVVEPSAPPFPFSFISAQFAQMDSTMILESVVPTFALVFAVLAATAAVIGIVLALAVVCALAALALLTRLGRGGRWVLARLTPKSREGVRSGYRRNGFGYLIEAMTANPVMPLVTAGIVFVFVGSVLIHFSNNSRGTEFFVETEPEQAIVYVLARGNLSLSEKDTLLRGAEDIVRAHPGVSTAFAFAGEGGLDNNTGGGTAPKDTIGQVQFETIRWEDRAGQPELDGDVVVAELTEQLSALPGIRIEITPLSQGPASAKPVHLRFTGNSFDDLVATVAQARAHFETVPGLTLIEDTRPLPGIDWQIDVDVEKAGQYGADVVAVGAMVQLVTRGILLDTMRVDTSDEEIDIRVRLPEQDRVLSTLDSLKVRTPDGLIPLSNFITRTPVPKLAEISRIDQKRYMDVKADVTPGLVKLVETPPPGAELAAMPTLATLRPAGQDADFTGTDGARYKLTDRTEAAEGMDLQAAFDAQEIRAVPINANERIAEISKWVETAEFADGIGYEWTGDQEDQAESQAFLSSAFTAALGLMFIILLAQFNSFYNAILVLLAVILSTTGVLIGMLVMDQTFSIIMTGTGIVALAGIVVNNNIILIDTYQEFSQYMPRIEAIIRTAQARIRPVLLTTITTMAGLAPMMFGLSLDFAEGGYTIDSPTALWWKQLATAVVFGLGVATVLTLMVTPSMLAIRVWATTYLRWIARLMARMSMGRASRAARDWALQRESRRAANHEVIWTDEALDIPRSTTPAE
ncbi:efflux RND transporter permease subunit [Sulfitobacter albidus]|uniref:Efflux RND transporter permease subunit n=1 Tax=Sulfitobacter albidus TaxID=2829501 RepID=A0A975PN17_9RHOB|nr:efflux RND transporter permease subunit [Sulfitobacter albidus]QUJ77284.1 efflux RND transporter permease subunit [Sulfitobacter albidus]